MLGFAGPASGAPHLGLDTASSVNVAETAPFVGAAVDRYLEAYVEIAPKLGAEWIVMHAGFHFTSDREMGMRAGLERLQRVVAHAEKHGALVLLENLNKEPAEAEVHYLAHTIEELSLLLRAHPVADLQIVVHRQPRASRARRGRRLCRRARSAF